jgi:twitching motility two-component system response regulator PilG
MTNPIDHRLREGIAAAQAKRFDDARALLQQVVEATPDNALGWFWLAVVSPTAEAAVSHLRRALALEPSYAAAREALAKILIGQAVRMCDSARRLFREAAGVVPVDGRIWDGLVTQATTSVEQLMADAREVFSWPEQTLSVEAKPASEAEPKVDAATDVRQEPEAATEVRPKPDIAYGPEPDVLTPVRTVRLQADPEPQAEPAPSSAPSARTVMVVDDSPTIRKILSLTLEHAGYAVVAEADGESALQRLDAQLPDVILLDIAMPGIDGYETCKRIKGDARTAHVPILMLSGKDALFDKVKGHMAGATEYLTKPFESATVLAAVDAACSKAA